MAVAQSRVSQVVDTIIDGKQKRHIGVIIGPLNKLPLKDSSCLKRIEQKSATRSILVFPAWAVDPGEGFWLRDEDYKTTNKVLDELRTLNFRIKLNDSREIIVSENEQTNKSKFDRLVKELKTELNKRQIKHSC